MPKLMKTWICGFLAVLLTLGPGCAGLSGPQRGVQAEISAEGGVTPTNGYRKVSGGGEVARWFLIGSLLAAVVFIDLLILPATYNDPFPCCRAVVSIH
ncbi:MAG: hypothetical protein JKY65_26840 [Planctomycetes bacterium]|nr:hypothetical protein [Planctomycetota bacterium]